MPVLAILSGVIRKLEESMLMSYKHFKALNTTGEAIQVCGPPCYGEMY